MCAYSDFIAEGWKLFSLLITSIAYIKLTHLSAIFGFRLWFNYLPDCFFEREIDSREAKSEFARQKSKTIPKVYPKNSK
jgi:hypothetical protein